ncbi:16S rRNA (cytidine(1402)-2'-O)-methyltransferase [candidate division WOR-1 bacterium RIFCSPLOWO2_02_FULL_46_20]|uniref:Ribosomal RNA small subunit methyltransferase I n=2 Tax=Saganbacteria TaxID=1703751 RepID=A0A1F4RD08_UNCSA|nr:MAG: 16S rRNA (cytidine(1402)-2'-O)-methyltransferase [candidate division WOR-1 bacterium RIFCSPHIGHO2_02_FULL_45_12]OGC06059.1 MAG: 16S rRNA (cytidine(1402)-2'-O)-methyltransferase [candidate division WOR-1 bacterium RIFCSPLOWO2_02_FULL_46_20]OGC09679.1 MAG: 16S rRNA (cytidine(1402)-2'-O)-methyltransferase [candidate division WOR-1 bacterium RIFCSPLOWO2_12_FULL_45_9]
MASLFVVATPIGNLEDMTFRAVRILSEVDIIAAEDTRHTKILLNKYDIHTQITSYHKFNIEAKTQQLVDLIKQGQNIALVTDSGMPGISDPGYELIRESIIQGIRVEPIPGPSAAITALAVSGLSTDQFVFAGFLPKKPGKKTKKLEALQKQAGTIIIYESPFRLVKTLNDIQRVFGNREVVVCRELTKKFEEIIRGKAGDVLEKLKDRKVKGEVVVVVQGQVTQRESVS